jgi:hypothetical protein
MQLAKERAVLMCGRDLLKPKDFRAAAPCIRQESKEPQEGLFYLIGYTLGMFIELSQDSFDTILSLFKNHDCSDERDKV